MPDERTDESGASRPTHIPAECACTGVRWCAACLDPARRRARNQRPPIPRPRLLDAANAAVPEFDLETQCAPNQPDFDGLRILPDFLSAREEAELLEQVERTPFVPSQSGRAKQHFGPRLNFNRRRVNAERFEGLPAYAFPLEERLRARVARDFAAADPVHAALEAYVTTDVFVLRYDTRKQSNLDFHLDDLYAYGELILDLSLESDATLSFYRGRPDGEVDYDGPVEEACVRAPLPARSLALLFGPARFEWEHALLAPDIEGRRTSLTLRTIGDAIRAEPVGAEILERARRPLPDRDA